VLADGLAHPEGPDVLPDGRIVFVETFGGRLSAWNGNGAVEEWAHVGGGPNACMVGLDGVYVTQTGGHMGPWRAPDPCAASIQRVRFDGAVETVLTEVDGVALSAPNDLSFAPDGTLVFTDPGAWSPERPERGRVCAVHADGTAETLVDTGPTFPNGVVVEDDGSVVWVESYTRRIWRHRPAANVELLAELPDAHVPDGLKVAEDGTLFVTSVTSGGVDVVSPDGARLEFVAVGGEPQNCVFIDDALVVTDFGPVSQYGEAGLQAAAECGRLLRLRVGVRGRPLFRGAIERSQR
jgi:gluconolactonase